MASSRPVGATPQPRQDLPTNHNHNRDLTLQKYLLLQEQHEFLRQHLDELRPLQTSFDATSPSASPTRSSSTSSFSGQSPTSPYHHRYSPAYQSFHRTPFPQAATWGLGLETVSDETILSEVALEEARLCHVNEGIKRTLTELLNCETVRGDQAFRTWVQCRLMDTERELRSGRRRRSAPEP